MTDSTTGALFVRTASGRISDANERAGRLLRSPVDALRGTAFDAHVADPYRARLATLDGSLRAGGEQYQVVLPFGPDATARLLRVSALRAGSIVLVDPVDTEAPGPQPAPTDPATATAPLTAIEATMLEMTAQGLTTAQIAKRLHYSDSNVNYHLAGLGARFGTNNRTALVSRAYVLGFLRTGAWPPRASAAAPVQRGAPLDPAGTAPAGPPAARPTKLTERR